MPWSDSFLDSFGAAIQKHEGWFPPGPQYPNGSTSYRNNNPGNLRSVGLTYDRNGQMVRNPDGSPKWNGSTYAGQTGIDNQGFAVFSSKDAGDQALRNRMQAGIDKGVNLNEFFAGAPDKNYTGYAPSADNNRPYQYAAGVAGDLSIPVTTNLQLPSQSWAGARPAPTSVTLAAQNKAPAPAKSAGGAKSSSDTEIRVIPDQTGNYTEWRDEPAGPVPEIDDIPSPYFATAEIWTMDTSVPSSSPRNVVFPDINPLTIDWSNQSDVRLLEFQYRDRRKGGSQFVFRVWMRNLEDVERFAKLCSDLKGIEFRWGYTNIPNGMRESVKGFVLSYMPEFKETGYEVTVDGVDLAYQSISDYKVRTFRAETGRISDIVCWIVRNDKIDPNPVIETSVEGNPQQTYPQSNPQTDWWFINEYLSKRAVSKSKRPDVNGSHAGYSAYLRDGRFHWHTIVPPLGSLRSKPIRTFVWGGVKDITTRRFGTVIDFNPEFHPKIFRSIGAGAVYFKSFNPITKEVNISTVTGSDVTDSMLGGSKSAVVHKMSPDDYPNRAFNRPDHQIEMLQAIATDRFMSVRDVAFSGTLRVLGDPWIGVMDVVNVIVQRPTDPGIIMSYDWIVMEAIHTITNSGEYTTELKMVRNPTSTVTKEAGKETQSISHNLNMDAMRGVPGVGAQASPTVVRRGVLEQKITIASKAMPARVGELFG